MGSEQSNQSAQKKARIGQLRRGKSVPEPKSKRNDDSRPGSCSPGLSVCSDSDMPYISYTVNRPIGDSPKLPAKTLTKGKSLGSSPRKNLRKVNSRTHNVVVVKPAAKEETCDKDPDIVRLQKIPLFLPVMRGTLSLPAPRDPEILERLDPNSLYKLCLIYEKHLNECATSVAGDQHLLALQIKDIDLELTKMYTALIERQKNYAKHTASLSKITEISNQISKCQKALDNTLDYVEKLNNLLPEDDKLEPFIWTTG